MSTSRPGRVVAIVQARMGSTRLPGKVLADLDGRPLVACVLSRVASSPVDAVVLATSDLPGDDALAEYVEALGFAAFRGSAEDVLSRYAGAARAAAADTVVRITSDCPFVDPAVIGTHLEAYVAEPAADYATNTLVRTFPIGLDVEVFSREALETAHAEARKPHEREHVTPYLYQHPDRFRLLNVTAEPWATHPDWRLTVDEVADLELARALYARLPDGFTLRDIVAAIEAEPALLGINAGVSHRLTEKPARW